MDRCNIKRYRNIGSEELEEYNPEPE